MQKNERCGRALVLACNVKAKMIVMVLPLFLQILPILSQLLITYSLRINGKKIIIYLGTISGEWSIPEI